MLENICTSVIVCLIFVILMFCNFIVLDLTNISWLSWHRTVALCIARPCPTSNALVMGTSADLALAMVSVVAPNTDIDFSLFSLFHQELFVCIVSNVSA